MTRPFSMGEKLGFVSAIRATAARCPDRDAWRYEGRSMSWRDLCDRAARIAGGLRALGVRDGDRVAILSANSDLYMILYLAIPWAGGVLTPLNARWSVAENAFAIDDCQPAVVLVSTALIESNAPLFASGQGGPKWIALDDVSREGWLTLSFLLSHEPIADSGRADNDHFAIFYTGGTTGRSKGVMISHAGILRNCMAMRDLGISRNGCRMLIVAPLFHMAAAAGLSMTMLAGGTAVIVRAFDATRVLDEIAQERATEALLVPTMIQMLLDAPAFDAAKLTCVQTILYGASPMPEKTLDRIMTAAPHVDFFQAYGMTELSCAATVLVPEYHRGMHREAGRHRGAGQPIAIVELIIADADGRPVPAGEIGEILVRGAGVMIGYWNQAELTADALRGGWMHTGDCGRLDAHGILYVVDRVKDMIVSGAENVYSAEVESAISSHAGVAQCAVIGIPDAQWGERVHAVIVPRPGSEITADAIAEHCRELIADYKCPRSVEFRTVLPLSPAGKILKAELRAQFWKGHTSNVA